VFKFITNKPFWVNALVAIALTSLIVFGFLKTLGIITKHGEYLTVPKVLNTNTVAAVKLLESKGFEVVIQDSVYTDTAKLGTVLKQFPEGNSTVKVNRLVLLTVNRVTLPNVDVPNLEGKSKEYAMEILTRAHLQLGDTTFKPSYMMGAVITQSFKGAKIAPGSKIPWGSKIDLEIGSGLSDEQFSVPSLLGLSYAEAKQFLLDNNILLASTIVDKGTTDTANAYVYKQSPPRENEDRTINYMRAGQVMDLWVSKQMKVAVDTVTLDPGKLEEKKDPKKENEKK
jgi:eukaryotic-like serine/threonine-protein kinase